MSSWKIELPDQCPPAEAKPRPGTYLRLLPEAKTDEFTFCSQREQNLPRPATADECGWASCSLLTYDENEADPLRRARDFSRLKSLKRKYKFFAKVVITNDSGVLATDKLKRVHYHLWAFRDAPRPQVIGFEDVANED